MAAAVNGDGPGGPRPPASELASASASVRERERELAEENKTLRQEVMDLRIENEDLGLLAQDYDTVLEKVLEGLRVYAVSCCCGPGGGSRSLGSKSLGSKSLGSKQCPTGALDGACTG